MQGKTARITGTAEENDYFIKKYGEANPTILIEDTDVAVFGKSWMNMIGNPACLLYAMRHAKKDLPFLGKVYYGKIGAFGEVVHEKELEVIDGHEG